MRAAPTLALEADALRVTVDPEVGGTILQVEHRRLGAAVLGATPWDRVAAPHPDLAAPDERRWLARWAGGWPLMFPNAGDACDVEGAFHGFHGEASVAPWRAEPGLGRVVLTRRFFVVPVEMRRELSVSGEVLTVRETVRHLGAAPIRVMWGHHPTFGADLLAAPFLIETGARMAEADAAYAPPANPLQPGARGAWPMLPARAGGLVDLSRPEAPRASLACLTDFASPWAAIRRLDGAVAAALSWDAAVFPLMWLWTELGGETGAPWLGRTRLIGMEPCTTWPAHGLATAAAEGAPLLALAPGETVSATVRLHVFRPTGPVTGVDAEGRATA